MEYGYLDKEVKALVAERDRLAAENEELRKKDGSGLIAEAEKLMTELATANATLDELREVFMRLCKGNEMSEALDDMDAILYPREQNDASSRV